MPASRSATVEDLPAAIEAITTSFHHDPLWGWAFPDPARRPDQYRVWWGLLLRSALRHGWVRVTDRCEAVALWLPPGAAELTDEEARTVEPMLTELLGDHAPAVLELVSRFEAARPQAPHYYLSLLGTHDDHRGKGIGMALLNDNLASIDAQHGAAYLESTNPANLDRYEGVGFRPTGSFSAPDGGPTVTTMWRDPR
jgi:GNAT superfamily N-acetyltransferase